MFSREIQKGSSDGNSSLIGYECPFPDDFFVDDKTEKVIGDFSWSAQEQGVVLGCFYYGFSVALLPGAFLAEKFGAKWILAMGMFGGAVCSLLSPVVVSNLGLWWFVALRILQGAFQGPTSAVMFTLMGKWLPVKERSFLSSMIFNGNQAATIFTLAISGIMAETLGWESIFYFTGSISALLGIAWAFIVYESPEHHPSMTQVNSTQTLVLVVKCT